ncbi:MAG: hypothetical protein IKN07_02695, partial [Lachnospiraceae bacterium]|nr:hypothetical protein [Lachnospiraceae bacterium]
TTDSFDLPVRILRSGENKGRYKIPAGSHIYTCFSSDFFHPDADAWRDDAWDMMHERSDCTFFMITSARNGSQTICPAAGARAGSISPSLSPARTGI